jgi:hypothetical protein
VELIYREGAKVTARKGAKLLFGVAARPSWISLRLAVLLPSRLRGEMVTDSRGC